MHGGEFLQTSHSSKLEHRSLSSPEGEEGIFRPVILMATDLLAVSISNLFHCGVMLNTVYLHENLVEVPLPLCHLAHIVGSPLADLASKVSSKPINPESYTFMANICAALMEQVLNIS